MHDDDHFETVLVRARALEAADDRIGSVRLLEAEFRARPDDPEVQFWLGRYLVAVDPDRAERVLEAAAQIEPQRPWFVARVAGQFVRLGQPKRANHFLDVSVRLAQAKGGPTDRFFEGCLWDVIGESAVLTEDFKRAEEAFRAAIASVPEDAFYVCHLARLLAADGREREARELVQKASPIVEDPSPMFRFLDELT